MLMQRSQRMKPVVDVARRREENRLRDYGQGRQRLEDALHKLQQLESYREEYAERLRGQGAQTVDLVQLQSARHFMTRLNEAIRQQQLEVERQTAGLESCRTAWLESRQHSHDLDDLACRYQREELSLLERKAQARADELAAQRLVWTRQNASAAVLNGDRA